MTSDRFPQAEQMAHESMERNLREQAMAIWPLEASLYDRYGLTDKAQILDVGCGTGEIAARLARRFTGARVVGVDLLEQHLVLARKRYTDLAEHIEFQVGDAYALEFADNSFDLTLNRHMLQSVPHPELIIRELVRLTRPGGWIHLLVEDYGMIHAPTVQKNVDRLWHDGVLPYGKATGTDLRIGRHAYQILRGLPVRNISIDYLTIDTLGAPRDAFAGIMTAWRDGYAPAIAENSDLDINDVIALFDSLIGSIRDENEYVVWHVPIASAQKT
ncbi:MAG: class I SAM-dependent methyltransferase [Gammaproteobacteria bacterium]|nr:class I SAM-dependent methyltransferase [Gammaproteobacteria bacterium]